MLKVVRPVAWQREIRDREAERYPRQQISSLDGCYVHRITKCDASLIIRRYEWLRTMPSIPLAQYGLFDPDGWLLGVACFGAGPGTHSRLVCGESYRLKTVCLERGACVHYAPRNAASYLVTHACRLANRQFGWQVFTAYADQMAGEIGTIYQACNWLYLGFGIGRTPNPEKPRGRYYFYHQPSRQWFSDRTIRRRGMKISELRKDSSWVAEWRADKAKYVTFMGTRQDREKAISALRYQRLPYPKRGESTVFRSMLEEPHERDELDDWFDPLPI